MSYVTTIAEVNSLIENDVLESKTLEYKLEIPGASHDERKEFLADISSFANSSGGQILYGISAENGIAREIIGIENSLLDNATLRLENLLRDSLQPRIHGIEFIRIPIEDTGRSILVLRVSKSFSSPHVVNYSGHWRFYGRNSGGKYPIDAIELRTAFQFYPEIEGRFRDFRAERISAIKDNQLAPPLVGLGRLCMHLIPLGYRDTNIDITRVKDEPQLYSLMSPIDSGIESVRFNLDGLISSWSSPQIGFASSYVQLRRMGLLKQLPHIYYALGQTVS
ncbi:MAG: ATP-binding protein [Anaerolineales bacterium]|nr:ATP-binding protein [Anaerolineales bacterium]